MLNQNQGMMPYADNMPDQGIFQAPIPSMQNQSYMQSGMQPSYAVGGRVMSSMMDSRFTQPHSQYSMGGPVMSSMMDSRFTQPHSQYADGGLAHFLAYLHHNRYAEGGGVRNMAQMAQQLRSQGEGEDKVLAHISPEEQHMLATMSGGTSYNPQTHLPQYGGGLFKKVLKFVAPVLGSVVGGVLGGPGGAALGGALGGGLTGGKKKLQGALLGGLGGYGLGGGFGQLGGIGNLGTKAGQALGLQGLLGKGASNAPGNATQAGGGLDKWLLPLGIGAFGLSALGKAKAPKESQSLAENVIQRPKWGPEDQPRQLKPYNRIAKVVNAPYSDTSEQQYFENANPEVEYMAHGGYLDGHTSGQDDKIPAELSDGEYVISADVVSFLGDGNNKAGAKKLDGLMAKARSHRNKGGTKLPPKSKGLEHYLRRRA